METDMLSSSSTDLYKTFIQPNIILTQNNNIHKIGRGQYTMGSDKRFLVEIKNGLKNYPAEPPGNEKDKTNEVNPTKSKNLLI